ncbi:hypothetical protein Mal48_47940 [Thalassoglobus polymorphus]|uniref:Uncharacterized protein n=1 Tax=Thalassoglobus polymorphus TaxID=2527994 RepID=A0A517QV95_9PLAN|nr:hypothetical protein Mal48_47940 [Thalassoglobus polymorphus]
MKFLTAKPVIESDFNLSSILERAVSSFRISCSSEATPNAGVGDVSGSLRFHRD